MPVGRPRKFKVQASVGKIICIVLWQAEEGTGTRHAVPHGPHTVITGLYYADLLCKLLLTSEEKRRGKLTVVPLLLHNNASDHRSHVVQAALLE